MSKFSLEVVHNPPAGPLSKRAWTVGRPLIDWSPLADLEVGQALKVPEGVRPFASLSQWGTKLNRSFAVKNGMIYRVS
ncbi:MAG: hypothetical protein H0U23_01390 [Blastocatellia bacterium]|nr:hypothetical protein [Blastocatellia bacterium]